MSQPALLSVMLISCQDSALGLGMMPAPGWGWCLWELCLVGFGMWHCPLGMWEAGEEGSGRSPSTGHPDMSLLGTVLGRGWVLSLGRLCPQSRSLQASHRSRGVIEGE